MNKIIITGRLTRDPEMVTVGTGVEKCRFSVAVDRRRGKDKEVKVDFMDCAAWASTGAFVRQWFHRGDPITVIGRMESNRVEKDGKNVVFWTLSVDEVEFQMGSKNESCQGETATDPESGLQAVTTEEFPF